MFEALALMYAVLVASTALLRTFHLMRN